MVTKKHIIETIDKAEKDFLRCWRDLRALCSKTSSSDRKFKILTSFQADLTLAIRRVDKTYRQIKDEKRSLVRRKSFLSAKWFRHRMALLSAHEESLKVVIDIGKVLGDSFAWMFYRKERHWISQHEKHQSQRHLPPGIGGIGEFEVIRNSPIFYNWFTIYHGMTTFLRLGDVSFFDLKTFRLAGIGEIKTTDKTGDVIRVQMTVVGDKPSKVKDTRKKRDYKRDKTTEKLSPDMKARLRRQIDQISEAFDNHEKSEDNMKLHLRSQSNHEKLTSLSRLLKKSNTAQVEVDDGFHLIAYRDRRMPLSSRIMKSSPRCFDKLLSDSSEGVFRTFKKNSPDNVLNIETLIHRSKGYQRTHGCVPPFWWPVDHSLIRDLLFMNVMAVSAFNPARLIEKLRALGLEISRNSNTRQFTIRKNFDSGHIFDMDSFGYYLHLIQNEMFTEESIVQLVSNILSEAEKLKDTARTVSLSLDIQHYFDG